MMSCHVSGSMTPRLLVFFVASKKWWGSLAAEKNRSRDSMCAMEWEGMVQDFPRDPRWEGKQVRQASVFQKVFSHQIHVFSVRDRPPLLLGSQISWCLRWPTAEVFHKIKADRWQANMWIGPKKQPLEPLEPLGRAVRSSNYNYIYISIWVLIIWFLTDSRGPEDSAFSQVLMENLHPPA